MENLMACAAKNWELRIGDGNWTGWLITAAYTGLVFYITRLLFIIIRSQAIDRRQYMGFWSCIIMIYIFLGLNKQLDLQTFLTGTGRCMSKLEGWYRERRAVQLFLIMGGLVIVSAFLLSFVLYFRRILTTSYLACLGVTCSLIFVVLRAVSFHHVDQFFKIQFYDVKIHAIIETVGIILVLVNGMFVTVRLRENTGRRSGSQH